MKIWAILYKLNQFSIPLTPHALSFQLTLTPPPFPSPKVFKKNQFRVYVLFLFACVCTHMHARVCIISMCVHYFFLSVSV